MRLGLNNNYSPKFQKRLDAVILHLENSIEAAVAVFETARKSYKAELGGWYLRPWYKRLFSNVAHPVFLKRDPRGWDFQMSRYNEPMFGDLIYFKRLREAYSDQNITVLEIDDYKFTVLRQYEEEMKLTKKV